MPPSPVPEIVEAIAEAKGSDPDELEITLHEYIDTDAIERLASHETASWILTFDLPEHLVTVTSDGLITVDGTKQAIWA